MQDADVVGWMRGCEFCCDNPPQPAKAGLRRASATQMARPGDIVLACGKGHEQSMCFGTTEYPWSDHAAMRALLDHPWPGNVRELDHTIERAVLMAQGETILASDLGLRVERDGGTRLDDMSLDEVERYLIKRTLARFGGNVSHAAEELGLSRSALYRRIQRFGL